MIVRYIKDGISRELELLTDIYALGKGLPLDKEKDEKWYHIGANQGLAEMRLTLVFSLQQIQKETLKR